MNIFRGSIPRSQRSDNLAKIFSMGRSSLMQDLNAVEAIRTDYESLSILSRLHKSCNDSTKTQVGDLDIAAQTPLPETKDQADFYGSATPGRMIDLEDDFADLSDDDRFHNTVDGDAHYDSLHKRSPAVINPSYFDAIRSSPSQGFGFGSSRYLDSSNVNYSLSMDDLDFEDGNIADSPRQTGGFGLSGFGRSPSRSVETTECLSFGAGRHYDRDDPPIHILDIPMPHPDVLEELANAPPREGKDSPFRSYYGHEPNLTDIDEETEPESDSGPVVIPTPLKNRHANSSRSHSVAKLASSPFARESSGSETPANTHNKRRKNTSSSLGSNGSRGSISSGFRRQNSAGGASGDKSALSSNAGAGSLPKIEEKDEDSADGTAEAIFACVKDPDPYRKNDWMISSSVRLPYDFSTTSLIPLDMEVDERTRLFEEPKFVHQGVIPEEYVHFEEPQHTNSPPTTPKSHYPEPEDSERESHHRESEPAVSDPKGAQPECSETENRPFPTRGSSLNATPRKDSAGSIMAKCPFVLKSEEVALYRQIAQDFIGTDVGLFADALATQPGDLHGEIDSGLVIEQMARKTWIPKMPAEDFVAAIDGIIAVGSEIMKKSARSVMAAVEIYAELGGKDYVKSAMGFDVGTVGAKKTPAMSYDDLETRVTGIPASGSAAPVSIGPFINEHNATFRGSFTERASTKNGGTPAAWANGRRANNDVVAGRAGKSSGSDDVGRTHRRSDDVVGRETLVGGLAASAGSPILKPQARASYGLWPQHAASGRSPRQVVTAERQRASHKSLPAGVPSLDSPTQMAVSSRALSLNKPLPMIYPSASSPARFSGADPDTVSLDFPGLPGLQRTPAEKEEIGRVEKLRSGMKRRLKNFWSKSDEDLAVKQASERENRMESANRLKILAHDMDANQPVQTPTSSRHITGVATGLLNPLVPYAPYAGDGDNQVVPTTTPKKRGVSMALAAAMGLGGRRKSIGENTRVNGA